VERGLRRPSLSLKQTLLLIRGPRSSPKRALDKSLLLHCAAGGAEGWTNSGGACDGRILNLRGHYDLPVGVCCVEACQSAQCGRQSSWQAVISHGLVMQLLTTKPKNCIATFCFYMLQTPLYMLQTPLYSMSFAVFCSLLCSFLHCSFSSFSCNK
jgi:hypothetical protein